MSGKIRVVTVSSLIAVALAVACTARAQGNGEAKPKKHTFTGVIESVDTAANTVTAKQKDESKTFKVTDKTRVSTDEKKEAVLGDLKVGDKVVFTYVEDGGALMAQKIAPPAEKKPAPTRD